jgi:hypothetical protein
MNGTFSAAPANRFKRWTLAICLFAAVTFAVPARSFADDVPVPDHDARLDGYAQKTVMDSGGTAFTYVVMALMGGIGIGVLFIKGKRTHLD